MISVATLIVLLTILTSRDRVAVPVLTLSLARPGRTSGTMSS
jgi:hypothetical protein